MDKGIEKNQNYTWLICAAQNMKNIVTKISNSKKRHEKTDPNLGYFIHLKSKIEKSLNLIKILVKPRKKFWALSTL